MIWKHVKTGKRYRIYCFGLDEATMQPAVVYQAEGGKGPMWVRPCAEFFDGRFLQCHSGDTTGEALQSGQGV